MSGTLLLGATGQLGYRLNEQLGARCIALDRAACDLTALDATAATALLERHRPSMLINATGYTAVDAAETDTARAQTINATAPALLAKAAQSRGIPFVHFSTDYVFDGARGAPYREDAPTNPLGMYGRSKLEGERAVLAAGGTVFRLQWLYDTRGTNFFRTVRRLLGERDRLRVVADQLGAPTYAPHAAEAILKACEADIPPGLYHLPAGGHTSWHGFACAIAGAASAQIEPITTAEYPVAAKRPKDARLDGGALASRGIAVPHWRDGLAHALETA